MTKAKNLNRFLLTVGLFFAGTVLSEVFVNIYLWKLKNDYALICTYLLACYVTVPAVFYACGWLSTRIDRVKIYISGIFFYALFYLAVLVLKEDVIRHLLLIGFIKGLAMGAYWFGHHILTLDYTDHGKRDSFYSTTSVISGSASMAGPFISGFIIKMAPGLTGYYIMFAATSFLLLAGAALVLPLTSVPSWKKYKVIDLLFSRNRKWQRTMVAYFFLSGKDSIMMFLMAILVVQSTGSEFTFGKFASAVAGIAILSSWLVGRFSKPSNRGALALAGASLSFLASLIITVKINFATLLIYGLIGAAADYLIRIPFTAYSMDLISLEADAHERKMEYIAARDIPIAFGRIFTLGIFLFLLSRASLNAVKIIIPLVSAFMFAVYWAMREPQKTDKA